MSYMPYTQDTVYCYLHRIPKRWHTQCLAQRCGVAPENAMVQHHRAWAQRRVACVALALEVPKNNISSSSRWIAHGPCPDVATYSGYVINGYQYLKIAKGKLKMNQETQGASKEENVGTDLKAKCKARSRQSHQPRSFVGSISLDALKKVRRMLSRRLKKIVTVFDDDGACPNVKVVIDIAMGEDVTIPIPIKGKIETLNQAIDNFVTWRRDLMIVTKEKKDDITSRRIVYSSKYTDVKGTSKLLNKHAMN
ncbi:unnamed protein product [Citrullus colocynthis]|uniref:Uncharacterized protein n=1 Tax=Citrullus colocynthis TaxID=252529 RepID=A0ABP0YRS2_9ROSI